MSAAAAAHPDEGEQADLRLPGIPLNDRAWREVEERDPPAPHDGTELHPRAVAWAENLRGG